MVHLRQLRGVPEKGEWRHSMPTGRRAGVHLGFGSIHDKCTCGCVPALHIVTRHPPTPPQAKVATHAGQCGSNGFTCLDCSRAFDRWTVAGHTSCVTEHEKYAQGATKPGGYASKGCFASQAAPQAAAEPSAEGLVGPQFLSERAPWRCSVCSVTCTSRESLEGHASGAKHQRRVTHFTNWLGGGENCICRPLCQWNRGCAFILGMFQLRS